MSEQKKHWRQLAGKQHLIGEMLNGKEVTLTIKTAGQEELQSQRGVEKKLVISFEETDQKLVVNTTNAKSISKISGSGFVSDWIGVKVTLYPVRGTFFGQEQEVIRIKTDTSNIKPIQS